MVLMTRGGGGHGFQAKRLAERLVPHCDVRFITTSDSNAKLAGVLGHIPVYKVPSLGGAGESWPARLKGAWGAYRQSAIIIRREKPDLVIGVASALSVPVLAAARRCAVECVFIESITRVHTPSNTLRLISRLGLARHIYVQWPELRAVPRVLYHGNLI